MVLGSIVSSGASLAGMVSLVYPTTQAFSHPSLCAVGELAGGVATGNHGIHLISGFLIFMEVFTSDAMEPALA